MEFYKIGCLLIGYLFGCFSTAYIIGKTSGKIDIREHGSGNAGTTNVIRVLGWKAGFITFLGDFFKGIAAIYFAKYLFADNVDESMVVVSTAMGVILGHNWPVFLNFKGGKGVATTIGIIATINFYIALVVGICMIAIISITKYVSLASIIAPLLTIILFFIFDKNLTYIIFTAILAALTIYKHKENIKRLLKGTESKIGRKK